MHSYQLQPGPENVWGGALTFCNAPHPIRRDVDFHRLAYGVHADNDVLLVEMHNDFAFHAGHEAIRDLDGRADGRQRELHDVQAFGVGLGVAERIDFLGAEKVQSALLLYDREYVAAEEGLNNILLAVGPGAPPFNWLYDCSCG
ncbi:MAG: hypothetical protein RLO04_00485 [Limnobacter sp.]|uniref:hypothetical protein n=1 Tax=Limnobacter sp. TaxID=2003368 RepID=UPI0032ED8DBB